LKKWPVKSIIYFLFIVIFLWSCTSHKPKKIMFIGIDALDWEMMDPLLAEGVMPHFMELKQDGTSVKVDTNDIGGSAVYWTTIATGKLSSKHGIKNFISRDPVTKKRVPVTSNMRKSKAFWNIFSENDISVGVIGWYVSWPAEEGNGFTISSYFGIRDTQQPTWKGTIYQNIPHMVYPEELKEEVNGYIRTAEERYLQNLGRIIKPSELNMNYGVVPQTKWAFLSDEIFHEAGINLYPKKKPQVFAVYLVGVDVVGHRFTFPKKARQRATNLRFGNVQRKYYLYMDEILAQYMEMADDNTVTIVAADHGLMRGHHTNNGVFMISGPGIKSNVRSAEPIRLTDMVPTMLYIMGLPVAKDMDGDVYRGVFEDEFLDKNPIQYIKSYGKRKDVSRTPSRSRFDEEILERLKSLGYIK